MIFVKKIFHLSLVTLTLDYGTHPKIEASIDASILNE